MSQSPHQPGKSATGKTRIALGSPIAWTDSDLSELANVSQADLKAAAALWRQEEAPTYKALLQAEVLKQGKEEGQYGSI